MPIDGLPGGDFDGCVREMTGDVADPNVFCAWMVHKLTGEWPAEESARETVEALKEAVANIADYLESRIHRAFTLEADDMLASGLISKEERIQLSNAIGDALEGFGVNINANVPDLRARPLNEDETTSLVGYEAQGRRLTEVWDRSITEARIDDQGNLSGVIVVEGESANRNYYTKEALESGIEIFRGKPIYADHPTRTEEADRPERSVRDLVGRLSDNPTDFWVAEIAEGPLAGRHALFYKNAKLSESADWLVTLIRECIAGDQSINATGRGDWASDGIVFTVEAFADATSLDFVTQAAAGGRGQLQESQRAPQQSIEDIFSELTFAQLVEARPDIVNDIATRERRKAYGEKKQLQELQEEAQMSKKLQGEVQALRREVTQQKRQMRQQRAAAIVSEATSGMPEGAARRVRRLLESQMRQFVEQEEAPLPVEGEGGVETTGSDLAPGSAPNIELPEDVKELSSEQQAMWLEAFTQAKADGMEEVKAVHKAWAAVIAAEEQGGEEVPDEVIPDEMPPVETMTEESLRRAIARTVKEECDYLAQVSGAGSIANLGEGASPAEVSEEQADAKLEEAMSRIIPGEQGKVAARGRAHRRW